MSRPLAEVPVADADPETADIYSMIMRRTGVGSPALIYRHLAVTPGLLDWTWAAIGPELENGWIVPAAIARSTRAKSIDLVPLPLNELSGLGVTDEGHMLIDGILNTYNRMNPVNLCLISALREIINNHDQALHALAMPEKPPMEIEAAALPAPISLADMPEDIRSTVMEMSDAIPSPDGRVIPTLYRHLAIWPDLLRHLAPSILEQIQSGHVSDAMSAVSESMEPLVDEVRGRAAGRIVGPPPVNDIAHLVDVLDSFLVTIPQLIVIGRGIRQSLPEAHQ